MSILTTSLSIDKSALDPIKLPVNNVQAIQTTRLSPFSSLSSIPPYHHFNLGVHVGDNANQVNANRRQLLSLFPQGVQAQWLDQVHGNTVAEITQVSEKAIVADAAVTRTPNIALSVLTADCLPILLTNQRGTEVAVIHGGWRPLAKSIIAETLSKFESPAIEIIAWFGPCIGNKAFEVGEEVREAFLLISPDLASAFTPRSEGKWFADLVSIASTMLNTCGVQKIIYGHHCTDSNKQRYYSYRRDQVTGRMASLICIKP
ncbi:peptidoglycan editing factor PgeF [Thalassotalea ganghwensis]